MSSSNPILRGTRRQDLTASNGQTVFGPLNFKLWDAEDLRILEFDPDAGYYDQLTSGFDIAKDAGFAFPTVTFAVGRPAGTQLRFEAARVHERQTDVSQGGVMRAVPLEAELDKQATIFQEVRRDLDDFAERAILAPAAETPGLLRLPDAATRAGKIMLFGPSGEVLLGADSVLAALLAEVIANIDIEALAALVAGLVSSQGLVATAFGAVGDNETNNDTALADAVNAAWLAGEQLYLPAGIYVTTDTIPHFHDVRWRGPGVVKRGSDLFHVEPRNNQSNVIHVASAGSADNDGLSAAEPTTLQRATAILPLYGAKGLPGRWTVRGVAGSYAASNKVSLANLSTDYPIVFEGPAVGHPNTPTMVINMTGDATGRGFNFGQIDFVWIKNIKVINAPSGYGFVVQRARMLLENCHVANCLYGVVGQHGSLTEIIGGEYDGNDIAASIGYFGRYGSSNTIGYSDTPANAALFHHWNEGLRIGEGTFGHLDGTRVHDCNIGIRFDRTASGCNTKNAQVYRNQLGILAEAQWFNNNIDFGSGANANTVNVRTLGSAAEYDYRNLDYFAKTLRIQQIRQPQAAHTGSTTSTSLWTLSNIVRPWMVSEGVDICEFEIAFEASLANGSCTFNFFINSGGDDFLTAVTVPQNTTDFVLRAVLWFSGPSFQRLQASAYCSGATGHTDVVDYGEGVLALKNASASLRVEAQLANAADSVTLRFGTFKTTLGG